MFGNIIDKYEVVIFDCQAGYSDILEQILPNVDETLFVMEADAISSSSIRSLHLKIGNFLTRKSYQVFNKVTTEEYEIYNKISGGTLFANIESVLFDWTIRKAFALSQIPTVEDVSYNFYEQILNICKVLFGEAIYSEKIESFSKSLAKKKIAEERKDLLQKLSVKKALAKNNRVKLLMYMSIAYGMAAFIFVYYILLRREHFLGSIVDISLICISMASVIIVIFMSFFAGKVNNRGESISEIQRKLDELDAKAEKYKN